jgi:plasmid stabilization system protein ParE
MADYEFHPDAEDELNRAADWYLANLPRSAPRFAAAVQKAIAAICRFPDAFPWYDDAYRFNALPRHPFVIYYRPGDPVRIVAFSHTARPTGYWHGRT